MLQEEKGTILVLFWPKHLVRDHGMEEQFVLVLELRLISLYHKGDSTVAQREPVVKNYCSHHG